MLSTPHLPQGTHSRKFTVPRRRQRGLIWGLLLGVAALTMLGAEVAHAETTLVSSNPADGEKILTMPLQITAVFSAAVPNNAVLQAVCEGRPAPLGTVTVGADGISLIAPVTGALPIGICNVTYSVPQADGKVVTGGFSFEVLDPATAQPGAAGGDTSDGGMLAVDAPPVSGPLGLARLIAYASLAALLGAAVLLSRIWPEGVDDRSTHKFLQVTWLIALISNYLVVVLRATLLSGKAVTSTFIPVNWGSLFHNLGDISTVLRFFLVAASIIIVTRPDRLLDPQSQYLGLAFPGLAMICFALSRSVNDFSVLGVMSGAVHNVVIAIWFGGLIFLAQTVLSAPGEEDLLHAIRGFSRWVPALIVATVASGLIHLYQLDGTSILTSRHGRLVIFKSLGVAAMVYIGVATRQYVARNLTKRHELTGKIAMKLRKAILTEATFGILVLAVTSWTAATLPPNVSPPGSDRTKYAYISDRSGGALDVQLKIMPATVGLNAVRIDLYSPETGLTDLKVQFNPPTNSTASVTLSVPMDGKGAARLPLTEGIPFGAPGLWTIIVTGNGPEGILPSVTYTLSVMANDNKNPADSGTSQSTVADNPAPATVVVPLSGIQPVTSAAVTSVP